MATRINREVTCTDACVVVISSLSVLTSSSLCHLIAVCVTLASTTVMMLSAFSARLLLWPATTASRFTVPTTSPLTTTTHTSGSSHWSLVHAPIHPLRRTITIPPTPALPAPSSHNHVLSLCACYLMTMNGLDRMSPVLSISRSASPAPVHLGPVTQRTYTQQQHNYIIRPSRLTPRTATIRLSSDQGVGHRRGIVLIIQTIPYIYI